MMNIGDQPVAVAVLVPTLTRTPTAVIAWGAAADALAAETKTRTPTAVVAVGADAAAAVGPAERIADPPAAPVLAAAGAEAAAAD